MNCNENLDETKYEIDSSSIPYPCSPRIILSSKFACPVLSLHNLWRFFEKYYYMAALFMMGIGAFLLAFGGRQYKVTFFLTGTFSLAALILITLFAGVYPDDIPFWAVWINLIVATGMGAGIGFAAARWSRVGVLLIGAWIGGLLGGVLYTSIFSPFAEDNPLLAVWLTIVLSAIVVAILSMVFFDHACIIGSAIGGSYCLIRVIFHIHNISFIGSILLCRRIS